MEHINSYNNQMINDILDLGVDKLSEGNKKLITNLSDNNFDILSIFEEFMTKFSDLSFEFFTNYNTAQNLYRYGNKILLRYTPDTKKLEIDFTHIIGDLLYYYGLPNTIAINMVKAWFEQKYLLSVESTSMYSTMHD